MRSLAKVVVKKADSSKWYKVGQVYEVTYLPSTEMYMATNGKLIEGTDIESVR